MDDRLVNEESSPDRGTAPSVGVQVPVYRDEKPLLVFDGNCGFCRKWIARLRSMTGERLDYAPYQEVGEQYPQIPRLDFETAVQLVEPGGRVFSGAEAVFRAMAQVPGRGWSFWFYQHVPLFAPVSRAAYRFVAAHRRSLSAIVRLLWGRGDAR